MTGSTADQAFEKLIQRFAPGARLLHAWELTSGIYGRVTALEVEHADGRRQKMIVRRHGPAQRASNPHVAADEFRLLHFLGAAGVRAPAALYLDESGEIFPTPCVVVEYIEGGPAPTIAYAPDLIPQLARQLAALHQLSSAPNELGFLPEEELNIAWKLATVPDESRDEQRIRETLQAAWALPAEPMPPALRAAAEPPRRDEVHAYAVRAPRRNPRVLLHGDFWPGNTLWRDGRLVAVIDWEDAALGDPLADLARSRLELLWSYGSDAMQSFTELYLAQNPLDLSELPYWELCAVPRPISMISDWGLDAARERKMRGEVRLFIDRAFEQLAARPPC